MKSNPTKLEFLNEFREKGNIRIIKILGHTGKSIFSAIENFARLRHAAGLHASVQVNLLLRDEGVETPKRREQIAIARRTIKLLNGEYDWLQIDIRFYSAIQTLRGAIVELTDGTKTTYFSAYHWNLPVRGKIGQGEPHPIKTSAVKWARVIRGNAREDEYAALGPLLENWFDYFWGPGIIHTIAFDFDDTIIDTYAEKIQAWVFAIDETKKKYHKHAGLLADFISDYGTKTNDKLQHVKRIVDAFPGKDEIVNHILRRDTSQEIRDFMEEKRSAFRRNALFPRNRTEDALSAHIMSKLFPGVRSALDGLAWRGYSLAVASLTDEERIEKALHIAHIPCINTIVGRSEYKNRELRPYLTEKIYLIRKIANLAGIPINRVLYVGDHHRDEQATLEAGASFAQARLLPQIEPSDNPETLYFENYTNLARTIDDVESRARARDIVPQPKINYA